MSVLKSNYNLEYEVAYKYLKIKITNVSKQRFRGSENGKENFWVTRKVEMHFTVFINRKVRIPGTVVSNFTFISREKKFWILCRS